MSELPKAGMQGRSGEMQEPICNKCGHPSISINGRMGCAKCDKPEANAGHQFIATTNEGKQIRFNTEKEMNAYFGIKSKEARKPIATNLPHQKVETPSVGNVKMAFELIDRELQNTKFETMSDAKKILSIRKKIHTLKFEVDNLIGGNK